MDISQDKEFEECIVADVKREGSGWSIQSEDGIWLHFTDCGIVPQKKWKWCSRCYRKLEQT